MEMRLLGIPIRRRGFESPLIMLKRWKECGGKVGMSRQCFDKRETARLISFGQTHARHRPAATARRHRRARRARQEATRLRAICRADGTQPSRRDRSEKAAQPLDGGAAAWPLRRVKRGAAPAPFARAGGWLTGRDAYCMICCFWAGLRIAHHVPAPL